MPDRKPPARIIKRYANRKLYDTRESRYVTLLDIARLIREGEELRIIDNKSKDDVTNVTFAQIIYEEEKIGDGEPNSVGVLREFIRSGTDKLLASIRESAVGRLVQRADQERLEALEALTTATERAEAVVAVPVAPTSVSTGSDVSTVDDRAEHRVPRGDFALDLRNAPAEDRLDLKESPPGTGVVPQGTPADPEAASPEGVDPVQPLALPTGADKSGVTSQAISVPDGAGKIQGMEESFSAQLSTGIDQKTECLPFRETGTNQFRSVFYRNKLLADGFLNHHPAFGGCFCRSGHHAGLVQLQFAGEFENSGPVALGESLPNGKCCVVKL